MPVTCWIDLRKGTRVLTSPVDIRPDHLNTVWAVLREHLPPDVTVWVFGSRTDWTTKDSSDLDLALEGDCALDRRLLERLRSAFEDSDLPYVVDVIDMHGVSGRFKRIVQSERVPLPPMSDSAESSSSWPQVAIGEVADVVGGGTPSTKQPDNFDGDIPWLTPKDLSGPHDRYIGRGERNLSQQGIGSSSAKLLPTGSVLLSTLAPIGYVALAKNPIATNQGFRSLVVRDGALPEYLYYWLKLNTEELERHASGSTLRELSGSSLKDIRLRLPPLDEQRAIARVLGALDDKIELNRRMSATLEAMARALFKSWFVDFEPVRAKVAGRPSVLPPALDALFPASFEASELGGIPSGWGVGTLGDVAETVRGRSYRSAELAGSDTALVTLKSFARGGGYRPEGLKPYVGKYKPPQIVEPGELVIACTDVTQAAEVIGRPAIVPADRRYTTLVASLDTLIIRPRDASVVPVPFLYCLTSEPSFTHHTYAHVSGTTVLHLHKEAVPVFKFPIPPSDVMLAFIRLAGPAFKRLVDLSPEAAAAAEQRNALLPRLVSGEVRIRETRAEIGATHE